MYTYLLKFLGKFSKGIGIDLGTANTLVHVRGRGILLNEPSVIALDTETNTVLAVGEEAKQMLGRTPTSITANRPLRSGVIADFDQTLAMLKYFIDKVQRISGIYPPVCIGIPSGVTEVEERAVREAAIRAGASEAFTLEEPHAAAIGAGLPVDEPVGSLIVDIGGGTCEVAVLSLGGIVTSRSLRTAGDKFDDAILTYIKKSHSLLIGSKTAEEVKIEIGSAYPLGRNEMNYEVRGRDLTTGLPKAIVLSSEEIREAISGNVKEIVDTIKLTLEATPPELASDIMDNGIFLAGGGALIRGLDQLIAKELSIRVNVAADPLACVVRGCAHALTEMEKSPALRKILMNSSYDHDLKN
ncbi:MAG: rod shape-determining protein [Armatimonadetes bacterium]|nr:rod shape-determining protein [Candidatus Hippobium faecium]